MPLGISINNVKKFQKVVVHNSYSTLIYNPYDIMYNIILCTIQPICDSQAVGILKQRNKGRGLVCPGMLLKQIGHVKATKQASVDYLGLIQYGREVVRKVFMCFRENERRCNQLSCNNRNVRQSVAEHFTCKNEDDL